MTQNSFINWLLMFLLPIFTSCIDDDRGRCSVSLSIQFTYKLYNQEMEYADAFSSAVDQVTLFVFDELGGFVMQQSESGSSLKRSNYRMIVRNLPENNFQLIVVGGLNKSSFGVPMLTPELSSIEDFTIRLMELNKGISDKELNPLFYGSETILECCNREDKEMFVEISLIKNTNGFRILLQSDDNERLNPDDFQFEIVDKNGILDSENKAITTLEVTYHPFLTGNPTLEDELGERKEVTSIVYAELSTSKLFATHSKIARLRIYNRVLNSVVLDIPIIEMVLLMKSEKHSDTIDNQTYLDRIHSFYMTLFMHNNVWLKAKIIINGWTININEIGDF